MKKKITALLLALSMMFALVACGGSSNAGGTEDTYELVFAHIFAGNGNEQKWFEYAKEQIEAQTDGHVILTIHPDGTLGSEAELTPQVVAGTIDMSFSALSVWGDAVSRPEFGWSDLPYLVTNYDEMNKMALKMPDIANQQCEEGGTNLYCLGAMSQGLRCVMTTNKEILTVDDMKDVKIRVPESSIFVKTVESFGASASVIPSSELYSALQSGIVTAYENDPATAVARGLHEVLKFYSTTNHIAGTNLIMCNKAKLESLPEEYQTIVKDVFADACAQQLEDRVVENNKLIQTMADAGVKVTELTDAQIQTFVDASKTFRDEFVAQYNLQDVMAQVDAAIAQ